MKSIITYQKIIYAIKKIQALHCRMLSTNCYFLFNISDDKSKNLLKTEIKEAFLVRLGLINIKKKKSKKFLIRNKNYLFTQCNLFCFAYKSIQYVCSTIINNRSVLNEFFIFYCFNNFHCYNFK